MIEKINKASIILSCFSKTSLCLKLDFENIDSDIT